MTFQPPPPPQGPPGGNPPPPPPPQGPPPGQPPSQWGPPPGQPGPGGSGGFDPKSVNQLDWGIIGAGVLAFIFSLFAYYTIDAGGFSDSESAWNGFFGWFAALLAMVGSAAVALELFQPNMKLPFPNRLIGLGAYALSVISVILALIVFPEDVPDGFGIDTGRGFGYWVSLIVIIAGAVLSFMRFQQTGGQLPIGGKKPGPGLPPAPPR